LNKKNIVSIIAAASTIAGGIAFSNKEIQATENKATNTYDDYTSSTGIISGTNGTVVNIATNLRVRSDAGANSGIIGYLYNGQKIEVQGEKAGWYRIKFNSSSGYISKEYVKLQQSASNIATTKKGQVINISSTLNIRQASSISSAVIGNLKNEENFDIISNSGGWYNIKVGTIVGFIKGDYVKELSSKNITLTNLSATTTNETTTQTMEKGNVINITSSLRVRAAAASSSSVLGYLYNGQQVNIKSEAGDWFAIDYNGNKGYVSKNYIRKTTSDTINTNAVNSVEGLNKRGQVINITSNLRVRTSTDTNSIVLGYLLNGQTVDVTGKIGDWIRINYNGKTGYINSQYIKFIEDNTSENVQASSTTAFNNILNAMKVHLGSPYVWGGSGELLTKGYLNNLKQIYAEKTLNGMFTRAETYVDKGYKAFDCSGLMQWGFKQAGITIGRGTYNQIENGVEVSLDSLKPGDLLFGTNLQHVGMYLGNNQWIEAPNQTANIRIVTVPWSKIVRARRILN
jgi:probable enterotoxin B